MMEPCFGCGCVTLPLRGIKKGGGSRAERYVADHAQSGNWTVLQGAQAARALLLRSVPLRVQLMPAGRFMRHAATQHAPAAKAQPCTQRRRVCFDHDRHHACEQLGMLQLLGQEKVR